MTDPPAIRLLQVDVTPLEPTLWKWHISEANLEVAHGYATSRETAQIHGDNALFAMLSVRLPWPSTRALGSSAVLREASPKKCTGIEFNWRMTLLSRWSTSKSCLFD
jgi:hypothetical protein